MVLAEAQEETWQDFYAGSYDLGAYLGNLARHSRFIESILADQPKRLLEVGTGSGTMPVFISSLGYDVTSIDNDEAVLSVASKTSEAFRGSAHYELADAFNLPYEDGDFDVAFSQGLMEHFSDDEIVRMLEEQLRVARAAVFSVPNNFYGQKDVGNERLLTKERWEQLVVGFHVVKSENYHDTRSRRHLYRRRPVMYMCKVVKEPSARSGGRNGANR
jgi:SAM-dependent methyltransferase